MKSVILSITIMLGIQVILNAQPFSATVHDEPILTNSRIYDYKEDSEGNVWFAGKKLLKYDGSEFVDMGFPSCPTNDCYITSIFFDSQGLLWLTGKGIGLNKFENNQFVKIDGPSDLFYADVFMSYEFQKIVVDKMGRVYAILANNSNGFQNHVFWDGDAWSEPGGGVAVDNDFEKVQDITIDNGDTVFIRNIFNFAYGLGDDFYYYSYDFFNLGICCTPVDIVPQADGSVLMLMSGDAGSFDIVKKTGQNWTLAQTPSAASIFYPAGLEVDISGRIWVVGINTVNNKLRLGYVNGQQIYFVTAAELGLTSFDMTFPYPLATSKNKLWVSNVQGSNTTLIEIHLDGINATKEPGQSADQFLVCDIYPNPTNSEAQIHVKLSKMAEVSYEVVNALGEIVAEKELGIQQANEMRDFELPKLKPGVYFVNLSADGQSLSRKLLVLD